MKRAAIFLLALAAVGVSTPTRADKVYIPIVDGLDAGGRTTRIWITNPEPGPAGATVRFLAANADRNGRADRVGKALTLGPVATLQLDDLATGAGVGLLEVDLAAGGFVQALRLDRAVEAVGSERQGQVPVVTPDAVIAGGRAAQLPGLANVAGGVGSHIGLMNLSRSSATCTVQLYRGDGAAVGTPTTAALEPLSLLHLTHAVDEPELAEARAEVRCSEPFYAYASLVDADGAVDRFVTPARNVDAKAGSSAAPTAAACPPAPAWCWSREGVVFTSTRANPYVLLNAVPPPHAYRRLEARWQVEINDFNAKNPTGAHGLLWLVRNNNKGMILSAFARGGAQDQLVMRHGMNNRAADKAKVARAWEPTRGGTYDFHYSYDAAKKKVVLTVSAAGKNLVVLTDRPNVSRMTIEPGSKLVIGLSNPGHETAEPASYGWVYKNLEIQLLP